MNPFSKYPTSADIAEMKARGYDATTIAEAERRSKRGLKALEVRRLIEDAFRGVTLGDGVGLQEARGLDDHENTVTCAAYRAADEKDDWQRISSEAISRYNDSLSFFDAEGMRFHLPAYLIAELKDEYGFGLDSCLANLSEHSISRFALLSDTQRKAVRAFLLHIAEEPDFESSRPKILRALGEYWIDPPAD